MGAGENEVGFFSYLSRSGVFSLVDDLIVAIRAIIDGNPVPIFCWHSSASIK